MPDTGEKPKRFSEPVTTITPVSGSPKNWAGSGEKMETQNSPKPK